MAQHNDVSDRELAGWLESLAPRRSAIDRERVLYEAGRAAGRSEQRRWRFVSLAATASGWLAAAVLLGLSGSRSAALVASSGGAKSMTSSSVAIEPVVSSSVDLAVQPHRDAGDVSANPSVPHSGGSSEWSMADSGPSLIGDGMLRTADLRRVSRTGRLMSDRPLGASVVTESAGPQGRSPRTNFEMRRSISAGGDLL